MPNKDPSLWAIVIAWLMENWPVVYGALLALTVSFLRSTYGGGSGRRRTIEALLCGLITLAVATGTSLLGVPPKATPLLGGMIGLLGIDIIREHAAKLLGKKEI
ncbi:phage holin, lambda family [Aeromonas jandaei]|uniref:phage holin, lambda family n=1 Tax=Aeromonas jandaei TaxID=650 RepID=UPI001ADD990B|nr:phage holin, lambda family [Aeromonas jandaei]QTL95535.1 Phage holin family (Lysis protein S) [Aeromonas jandaei]